MPRVLRFVASAPVALAIALGAPTADAEEPSSPSGGSGAERPAATDGASAAAAPRDWVSLRAGGSTGNANGRPEVCAEVSPWGPLSVEACGSGNNLWHDDPEPAMSHYRADLRLGSWRVPSAWIQPRVGAGFAELQVGPDRTGFAFADAGPTRLETSGPEACASVQLLVPIGHGFELVGNATVGAAWLAHAGELLVPQRRLQPFAGIGAGVGF